MVKLKINVFGNQECARSESKHAFVNIWNVSDISFTGITYFKVPNFWLRNKYDKNYK